MLVRTLPVDFLGVDPILWCCVCNFLLRLSHQTGWVCWNSLSTTWRSVVNRTRSKPPSPVNVFYSRQNNWISVGMSYCEWKKILHQLISVFIPFIDFQPSGCGAGFSKHPQLVGRLSHHNPLQSHYLQCFILFPTFKWVWTYVIIPEICS